MRRRPPNAARAGRPLLGAGVDDPRARPLTRRKPTLGDQFGIRVGDCVAGQSKVGGQMARWWQHGARGQSAGAYGVAQRGEKQVSGPTGARLDDVPQVQMQVTTARIGPRIHGQIEPCDWVFAH